MLFNLDNVFINPKTKLFILSDHVFSFDQSYKSARVEKLEICPLVQKSMYHRRTVQGTYRQLLTEPSTEIKIRLAIEAWT